MINFQHALNFQRGVGTEQLGPFVPVGYTGRDERGHLAVTGPPTPFVPVGYTGRDERVLTGRDEMVPYASEDSGRRGRAICRGPGSGRDKRGRTKGPFSTSEWRMSSSKDEKTEKSEKTEKLGLGLDEALYVVISLVPVCSINRY